MIAAQSQACWSPDRERQGLPQQGAALGRGVSHSAAQLETVEQRGSAAGPPPPIEGVIGKKRRRERSGLMGTAPALKEHPSHGFAGRAPLWRLWHEPAVNRIKQP
jgi:hypothetical protein